MVPDTLCVPLIWLRLHRQADPGCRSADRYCRFKPAATSVRRQSFRADDLHRNNRAPGKLSPSHSRDLSRPPARWRRNLFCAKYSESALPLTLSLIGLLRFVWSLVPDEAEVHTTRGHINPVSWFYLSHALLSAGFRNSRVAVDKYQRRSLLIFPLLIIPIRVANRIVYRRDKNTYGTMDERNAWTVRAMNSPEPTARSQIDR